MSVDYEMMQRGTEERRRGRRSEFGWRLHRKPICTSTALLGALLATACAGNSAPRTQPQTSVRLEAPAQSTSTAHPVSTAPLPALPMSSTGTISDGGGRRIQSLD